MVVDLAPGDHRRPLVEQARQRPDQPGLTLAAFAEQDNVVTGDQRPLQVRPDRQVEAEYPRKRIFARTQPRDQVAPNLVLDGGELMSCPAQFAQCFDGWSCT